MQLEFQIGIPHGKAGIAAGVAGAARDTLEGVLPPQAAVLLCAVLRLIIVKTIRNDTIQNIYDHNNSSVYEHANWELTI